MELIEKALEAQPQNSNALYTKGWILDEMDLFDPAIAAYEAARQLDPQMGTITYNIACSYARGGRFNLALQELAKLKNEKDHMQFARQDPDFEALRKQPEYGPKFEELTL